jgi:hypothetical protein
MSFLTLEGISSEIGAYACQWNNSQGEPRYRNFTVIFIEGTSSEMEPVHTTIIAFAITLAVLIVLGIGISVKLYFDLVSDIFRRYKIAVG